MVKEQYQAFKLWLQLNNKLPEHNMGNLISLQKNLSFSACDIIETLYSINMFIVRNISQQDDLFTLIKNKNFNAIYKFRSHWRNKITHEQNTVLRLCFEYLNSSYDAYEEYEAIKTFSKLSKSNTLFIHQGNIACLKYKHPLEDVKAAIVVNSDIPLYIHASRCKLCNIVFIRKEEYNRLRKRYPFLVANFCEISSDGYTPIKTGSLSSESLLMICGYNVKLNGTSEQCRHMLLKNILYNGILSKTEIIQYLEHFISFNGSRESMANAVQKWETDLAFIRNLDLDSHPTVTIDKIKPYTHK